MEKLQIKKNDCIENLKHKIIRFSLKLKYQNSTLKKYEIVFF